METPAATIAPLVPSVRNRVYWYLSCDLTTADQYRVHHIFICKTKQEAVKLDRSLRKFYEIDIGVRFPHIDWIVKGSGKEAITSLGTDRVCISDPDDLLIAQDRGE